MDPYGPGGECGFTDTSILDIVLLTSWRNFVNRVCEGLGVEPATRRSSSSYGRFQTEELKAVRHLWTALT